MKKSIQKNMKKFEEKFERELRRKQAKGNDINIVSMRTTDYAYSGSYCKSYPVTLYNCLKKDIGVASGPDQVIEIWNLDPVNQQLGKLLPNSNRSEFTFKILMNSEKAWLKTQKETGAKFQLCVFANPVI